MTDTNETPKPAKRRRRTAREPQSAAAQDAVTGVTEDNRATTPSKPASKASLVLELLHRPDGVTIPQLTEATGWLPHTTRAALTGLKKKGHAVTSTKAAGENRVYRVAAG